MDIRHPFVHSVGRARRMQGIESDTGYDTLRGSSDGALAVVSQTAVCDTRRSKRERENTETRSEIRVRPRWTAARLLEPSACGRIPALPTVPGR